MVYTCQYQSPMGDILLAADEIGLTGLWFVGQKYFANVLPDEHISQEIPIPAKNRILHRLFIRLDLHSDRKCGRFCCRFRMVRQRHTERLPDK